MTARLPPFLFHPTPCQAQSPPPFRRRGGIQAVFYRTSRNRAETAKTRGTNTFVSHCVRRERGRRLGWQQREIEHVEGFAGSPATELLDQHGLRSARIGETRPLPLPGHSRQRGAALRLPGRRGAGRRGADQVEGGTSNLQTGARLAALQASRPSSACRGLAGEGRFLACSKAFWR